MTSKWRYWDTTTESVCNSFVQLRADKKAAVKAFWLWMDGIIQRERKTERESIIKLLDEYQLPHWAPTEYIEYTEGYITGFQDALALIQGEELIGIDPKDIDIIKGKSQKDNEIIRLLTEGENK